jgi:hypothetical protein
MIRKTALGRALVGLGLAALMATAAFYASPVASGQDRVRMRKDLETLLRTYDEVTLDPANAFNRVRQTGKLTLTTSKGTFDLTLKPYDMRAPNYRAEAWDGGRVKVLEPGPVRTYKGEVNGMSGAEARFTLDEQTLEGLIITKDELFFIEPAKRFSGAAAKSDFVFYAESDVKEHSLGECGVTLSEQVKNEVQRVNTEPVMAAQQSTLPEPEEIFGPALEVDIATEADFEFVSTATAQGGGGGSVATANARILSIMNQVDGIYAAQLGLRFRVVFQRGFDTNTDPYTAVAASQALTELRTSYNSNPPPGLPSRDIVHMWSGKDFTDNVIGIAYSSGFQCGDTTFAYGISQLINQTPQEIGLTAHEIGHNFGACHPNQTTCIDPVPAGCAGSIMNSFITPSTEFCQFSLDQITNLTLSNSFCLTRLTAPGCNYSVSPPSQLFGSGGGSGNVNVATAGGCSWAVAEGADWLTVTANESGSGPGTASFSVAPNTGLTGTRRIHPDIAGQTFTITQAASPNCPVTPISAGQTLPGDLAPGDCLSGSQERATAFVDRYSFSGLAGQQVRIEMNANTLPQQNGTGLDTFVYLIGPNGDIIAEDDDSGPSTNSRLPAIGFFSLPAAGTYFIEATSFNDDFFDTGAYTVTLTDTASLNTVGFDSASYTVSEGVQGNGLGTEGLGFRTIVVNRSGSDTTGAASIDYATSNGTADARKDYTQSLGTLRFAPGQTQQSFRIFISDDRFLEPSNETVNLTLSNPIGTTLGPQSTAVLSIVSDDVANASSPVRAGSINAPFFVRQQYLDFLNREPDLDGLNFWLDKATNCGQADLLVCRINVSAAFFLSIENQETGYLTHRAYKIAFGNIPGKPVPLTLPEYLAGGRRIGEDVIVGVLGWEQKLQANKVAFFNEFVATPRFTGVHGSKTNEQYVDALNLNSGGALSQSERDGLIAQLNTATRTRAEVLRAVAEDPDFALGPEQNRAFVLAQYLGYLRRNPDDVGFDGNPDPNFLGYQFWLDRLNQFNGNFIDAQMVKAFLESIEYVERFGL